MTCDCLAAPTTPVTRAEAESLDDTLFITPDVIDLLKVPIA
jgi:hypothetical protein